MRTFSSKLYTFALKSIQLLFLIFTAILLISGFLKTCFALDMTTQVVLTRYDHPLFNLAGIGLSLFLLLQIGRFICKNPQKRIPILLAMVMSWYAFAGLILIVFSKTVPAADAWSVYSIADSFASGDMSAIHPTESYLSYYPHQLGLISFYEILLRIWNLLPIDQHGYHFIKCIYVGVTLLTILFQYKTVKMLWDKPEVHCTYLLLAAANLPYIMYTSFVYGEIPSFAALSAGIYYVFRFLKEDSAKKSRVMHGLFSLLLLTVATALRTNSLIIIIAVLLVVFFQWIKEKKHIFLVFIALTIALSTSISPLIISIYEHRANNTLSSGEPAIAYIAMGMQEASRGPGWYNCFNFNVYRDSGLNSEVATSISLQAIDERLNYFKTHPYYATHFYLQKYLTQWVDGTYASRQATLATFGGRHPIFTALYEGNLSPYYIEYGNIYQNVIYLGTFLFALFTLLHPKKKHLELPLYMGLIAVFGGFLFHMLWEANSRYIFLYSLLLLPYAAYGITTMIPAGKAIFGLCATASKETTKKTKIFKTLIKIVLPISILGLLLLFLLGYLCTSHYSDDSLRQEDVYNAENSEYNGLLLSMYSTENFDEEVFSHYRGVPTLKASHTFETLTDVGDYLDTAFAGPNTITDVYICIDPAIIGEQFGFHASLYHKAYQKQIINVISAHPETKFEFLLPYHSLEHWSDLPEKIRREHLEAYQNFINIFVPIENATVYYLGFEEWLIANRGNYESYNTCNLSVTSNLLTLTFKNDYYKVTLENATERLEITEHLILKNQESIQTTGVGLYTYDFSDYEFVFFGDSVIGNFTNSLSIPGVLEGNGSSKTYNLGEGGTTATMVDEADNPDATKDGPPQSLNTIVNAFLAKDPERLNPNTQSRTGLIAYMEEHQTSQIPDTTGTKTCFVINYGLNDFFEGHPVSSNRKNDLYSYQGSLYAAITKLQAAYPDCTIVLLTPTFSAYYQNGTVAQGTNGGILTEYVDAVMQLSNEPSVYCIDNYHNSGITKENHDQYLSDGCHPNNKGRFLIGTYLLECLSSML